MLRRFRQRMVNLTITRSPLLIILIGLVAAMASTGVIIKTYRDGVAEVRRYQEDTVFPALVSSISQGAEAWLSPVIRGIRLLSGSRDWEATLERGRRDPGWLKDMAKGWARELEITSLDVADRNHALVWVSWSDDPVVLDPSLARDAWFYDFWARKEIPRLTYSLYEDSPDELQLYVDCLIHGRDGEAIGSLGAMHSLAPLARNIGQMLRAGEHVLLVHPDGNVLLDLTTLRTPSGGRVWNPSGFVDAPAEGRELEDNLDIDRLLDRDDLKALLARPAEGQGTMEIDGRKWFQGGFTLWPEGLRVLVLEDSSLAVQDMRNRLNQELAFLMLAFLSFAGGVVSVSVLLQQRLRKAGRKLQDSNRRIEDLMAVMSHGLGNEMLMLEKDGERLVSLVRQEDLPSRRKDQMLGIQETMSNRRFRIRTILQNSMHASRLEGADSRLVMPREFPLVHVWDKTRALVVPLAREKEQGLHMPDCPDCTVVNDPDLMGQILLNLLLNAVKFTPPGGRIQALCRQAGGRMEILVQDSGPGFTPGDRQQLFRKFARLSARPTGGEHSTGLGLHTVQVMARLCGISLHLDEAGGAAGYPGASWHLDLGRCLSFRDRE